MQENGLITQGHKQELGSYHCYHHASQMCSWSQKQPAWGGTSLHVAWMLAEGTIAKLLFLLHGQLPCNLRSEFQARWPEQ